jgi:uncharacterized iron-regulated membrane protein
VTASSLRRRNRQPLGTVEEAITGESVMAANALAFVFGIIAPLAGVSWLLVLH